MDCDLFKVRIENSDARRGKSGGYRIIYYLKTEDHILLVTIYSKSDKPDVPVTEIRELIKRVESETPENLEEPQWFKTRTKTYQIPDRHLSR